jgi:WD40 repeat protein
LHDFEGNILRALESNNARSSIGQNYGYHCFTKSYSHLFSYSYYVKSQLFNLSDFSMKPLWGHTTYERAYKELYYNDVNHNFGINIAAFSPDETYLVAGACHGKYAVWKLPSLERIELIPNSEYLTKMPNSEVVLIGKNRYLKNRNHQMRNIQFWENGKYFSFQINEDTLIFNNQFQHIQTLENSGTVKCFGEFSTSLKDNKLTIYK